MTQFQTQAPAFRLKEGAEGKLYIDYRATDELRRMMTPNGKIYSRKRPERPSAERARAGDQARPLHGAAAVHQRDDVILAAAARS
jgi:ribosomal protein S18